MSERNKIIKLLVVWVLFVIFIGLLSFFYIKCQRHKVGGSEAEQFSDNEEIISERYYAIIDTEAEARNAAANAGGELESYDNGIAVIIINRPLYRFLGAFGVDAAPEEVMVGDSVLRKEEVYHIDEDKPPTRNTYRYQEWYLDNIGITNAYKNGITGKGTLVAVIDTGCQVDHPDLQKNIIGWYNANDPSSNDVYDYSNHGTHVAGIIAAADNGIGTVGVAPDASLYIIKVDHGTEGYMYISDIIRGINKAIEIGADVINMSLGGYSYNSDYEAAINAATSNGAICIAAAGNESTDKLHFPAAYGNCLGVGSYQSNGDLANSSNYGPYVEIGAPGVNLMSTLPGGYGTMSGTSMATPVVSGIAALIYGNDQGLRECNMKSTSDYVRSVILNNRVMNTHSSAFGTVTGSANILNMFNYGIITTPEVPVIKVSKQESTGQQLVKITCKSKNADIYYTTDGTYPYIDIAPKYTGTIHIDKKGTVTVKAVAVNRRVYSKSVKTKVTVTGPVYSQALIDSMRIHFKNELSVKGGLGKTKQLYVTFDKNPKKTVDLKKIKWSSSDNSLATVSSDGKVTITSNKKKSGKTVTITGKLGSIKKTFTFVIK